MPPSLPNKIALAACFAISIAAVKARSQVALEDEPNDSLEAANAAGVFHPGDEGILFGAVGVTDTQVSRDVDLYRIDIAPEATGPFHFWADVSTTDAKVDLYLRLFDSDGRQLQRSDDRGPGNRDPLVARTILAPQRLYVGVSANVNTLYDPKQAESGISAAGGEYHLLVSLASEQSPASPLEPNDSLDSPTLLAGQSLIVPGEFIGDGPNGESDEDVYRLGLSTPAIVRATVRATGDSLLDPFVSVRRYIPQCPCEDDAQNDDLSPDSVDAQVAYPMFAAGEVTIWVRGGPWETQERSFGYYDLEVDVAPMDVSGAHEPNDSVSMATPIGGGGPRGTPEQVVVDAFLGDGPYGATRGDRDFYAYWPPVDAATFTPQPRFLELTVAPSDGSPFVPIVSAYDVDGRLFARTGGQIGAAKLLLPAVCVEVDHDRGPALYLAVASAGQRPILDPSVPPAGSGADVRIEEDVGQIGPYRLMATPIVPSFNCDVEPNDGRESATYTGLHDQGSYVCGGALLDYYGSDVARDKDVWSFSVMHVPALVDAAISVCRTYDSQGLDNYTLSLLEDDGTVIQSIRSYGSDEFIQRWSIQAALDTPGSYYLEVRDDYGYYDLAISLAQGPADAPLPVTANVAAGEPTPVPYLYASWLEGAAQAIDVLDPISGEALATFAAPELPMTGAEALVANAEGLLFAGMGTYPLFYQLTPFTGEVVDSFLGWFGSGQYSDAVMLGDTLYVLDLRQQSIHAVDPQGRFVKRTLPVGNQHGISIGGGLAALAAPNRLYVADAFNTRRLYEIDPNTGALLRTLPKTGLRAVALGGLGDSELFVGDWTESRIDVLDRDGTFLESMETEAPTGSIGGTAYAETPGDVNGDGQIDLRDVARLYACFGSALSGSCVDADLDADGLVDVADAEVLARNLIGP